MEGRQRLFTGSNQVLLVIIVSRTIKFVQSFIEFRELSSLSHHVSLHHEGGHDFLVTLFTEEVETIANKGLIQVDTVVYQEETSVASNLRACIERIRALDNRPRLARKII